MNKDCKIELINEGNTDIFVFKNKESKKGPGTKDKLPFYNPSMELNRDLSVLLCQKQINSSERKLELVDGLASTGIRGLRFANELTGDFNITINDWNPQAFELINKNVDNLKIENINSTNINLNTLLSQKKFDYIDIDPFGSPAYFIDSAMRSIKNNGIIACTATDTAALCGTYKKACMRRYSSVPFHSIVMKEIGIRILLGFICRTAGIYEKALSPIISYSTDHYFRVYLKILKGATKANQSIKNYKMISSGEFVGIQKTKEDIGPLWMGKLQDKGTIEDLIQILFEKKLNTKNELLRLLDLLKGESNASDFFYTTEGISSKLKKSPPKLEIVLKKLKDKGYHVYKTHFSQTGFKTNAPINEIEKVFNKK